MVTLLYIYFILCLVVNVIMYFVSYTGIWDDALTKIRNMSNDELSLEVRKKIRNKVIVTSLIIILMLLFI